MFGRAPKTRLPYLSDVSGGNIHQQAKENDTQAKQRMKQYADHHNKAKHNDLHIGDTVLVKYCSEPFIHL